MLKVNEINKLTNEKIKGNEPEKANFISMINDFNDKNISISLKYIPRNNYIKLRFKNNKVTKEVCNDADNYYYGISPELKTDTIINAIKNDTFGTIDGLQKFVIENIKYFSFVDYLAIDYVTKNGEEDIVYFKFCELKKYETDLYFALAMKLVLQMVSHYGYKVSIKNLNNKEEIRDTLKYNKYINVSKSDDGIIEIHGRYCTILDNEDVMVVKDKNDELEVVKRSNSINQDLNDAKVCILGNSEYYNGVLPRVIKIVKNDTELFNDKIDSYIFEIERATYATTDGLDYNDNIDILTDLINKSKFKKTYIKYVEALKLFNEYRNELQKKYIYTLNTDEVDRLENINKFLKYSFTSNNIAVSTNIITKDDYLIYGIRNVESIDSNLIYCSVNGQAEIVDNKVEFYNKSVFEDYPTIDVRNKIRLDFKHEFSRETIAELSITDFERNYKYYGFSVLANNYDAMEQYNSQLRFHFNILATSKTEKTIDEINSSWSNSIESFENKKIFGIKNVYFSNNLNKINHIFKTVLDALKKNKSLIVEIITAFFSVLYVIMNDGDNSKISEKFIGSDIAKDISNWLAIIITIYSLYLVICEIISFIKGIKYKGKTNLKPKRQKEKENFEEYIDLITSKCSKKIGKSPNKKEKKNAELSPVCVLLTCLYLNDKCK